MKYGARTYKMSDGVVVVKQTEMRDGRPSYVVSVDATGNHRERHCDPGLNQVSEVGTAVLEAHEGRL